MRFRKLASSLRLSRATKKLAFPSRPQQILKRPAWLDSGPACFSAAGGQEWFFALVVVATDACP